MPRRNPLASNPQMGTAMIRTTIRTVVSRPLAGVFAYLADFGNLADYEPWVTSIEATSVGPVRAGSSWRHTRVRGRRRIDAPIELVEYEPSRLLAIISGAKGFAVRSTQSFRAVGEDSTEVVEVLEMRLGGARQAV